LKILISIDDTDNLESPGTGHLAANLIELLDKEGLGKGSFITRHQLYVHPDIPYTSHNSAMCFEVETSETDLVKIKSICQDFLIRESAPGSDPGLCIVNMDTLRSKEALISYGKKAKNTTLNKKIAYELAKELDIHLSEHGGTGGGVIGALAGTGLRLSGSDGRIKGHYKAGEIGEIISVKDLLDKTGADSVKTEDGYTLQEDNLVRIGKKVKAVYLDHRAVILVFPVKDTENGSSLWETCSKEQLKKY
jgi:hypothetical protein